MLGSSVQVCFQYSTFVKKMEDVLQKNVGPLPVAADGGSVCKIIEKNSKKRLLFCKGYDIIRKSVYLTRCAGWRTRRSRWFYNKNCIFRGGFLR
jgi:hypothetical protein